MREFDIAAGLGESGVARHGDFVFVQVKCVDENFSPRRVFVITDDEGATRNQHRRSTVLTDDCVFRLAVDRVENRCEDRQSRDCGANILEPSAPQHNGDAMHFGRHRCRQVAIRFEKCHGLQRSGQLADIQLAERRRQPPDVGFLGDVEFGQRVTTGIDGVRAY